MAKRGSLVSAAFFIIKHHFGRASNVAKFKECDCFDRQKMKMKLNKFMYGERYEFLQLDEEKVENETDGKIKEAEKLVVKEKDEEEKNEEEKPDEMKKVEEENEKKKKDGFYSSSMESLSKVMIVQGIGDMSLKSSATLLSIADKSPKEGSVEVIKSMTGIDAKEQMRTVTKIMSYIENMDKVMNGKFDNLTKQIDVMDGKVHNITEKMDAIDEKLHITEKIDGKLDNLTKKMDVIDGKLHNITEKIDGKLDNLTQKMDALVGKLDNLSGKLDAVIPPATPQHSPSSAVIPPPPSLSDSENGGNGGGYLSD